MIRCFALAGATNRAIALEGFAPAMKDLQAMIALSPLAQLISSTMIAKRPVRKPAQQIHLRIL
jgi:hypothetical protein